jgi:hypothetical protein
VAYKNIDLFAHSYTISIKATFACFRANENIKIVTDIDCL